MGKKYAADPSAPKRPLGAYFLFAADVRGDVIDNLPGKFSLAKVGKKIGSMWKGLSNAKKGPYQKKAEVAKAKWTKANDKYKSTSGYKKWVVGREDWNKAQKASDKRNELKAMIPNKPKKGPSAYMRFCSANRKKQKGSFIEVAQALGRAWADATDTNRSKYQKQVEADTAKYDRAMAKYVQTAEYKTYETAFKANKTESFKIKNYGSVAAANRAERTRLAARATTKRDADKARRVKAKARKAAIKA